MKKSIFRSISQTVIFELVVLLVLITGVLHQYFDSVQHSGMRMQTELIAKAVEDEGTAFFDRLEGENYRITYINPDGSVIYDSQEKTGALKNHFDREEVREAIESGYGESDRYSDTLLEKRYYSAKRLDDGSIIRLSGGHYTLLSLILIMLPFVTVISIAAILFSLVLASRLSDNIVRPLNELNLDRPEENTSYEELHPLLARIHSQQEQLKFQETQLRHKEEEFNTATADMEEGLILLSDSGTILSINHMACRVFGLDPDCAGKKINAISPGLVIADSINLARAGESSGNKYKISGLEYQINISPVVSDDRVAGVAVLIFDITEKERTEQIRREFTSNVSHELKTPLHSISGYAELLMNGLVREEDIRQFAGRIYSEAKRLTFLVEDIIRLSHLEEGGGNLPWEEADLYTIAERTVELLLAQAQEANVSISLSGEHIVLWCCPQLVERIVFNLCDNAIKYNRENGTVDIEIRGNGQGAVLVVCDSGIGIPEDHRERIFERFYRVDKSHSKAVGGTGLGLSIVKHSARLHDAQIAVESRYGIGTRITVTFPRKRKCDTDAV